MSVDTQEPNDETIEYDDLDQQIIDALACDTQVHWTYKQRKAVRALIESAIQEAREDENHQALADFEPEFMRLQRPHRQGRLTRVGEETFEQLKQRSRYHHRRLKYLVSLTKSDTDKKL